MAVGHSRVHAAVSLYKQQMEKLSVSSPPPQGHNYEIHLVLEIVWEIMLSGAFSLLK